MTVNIGSKKFKKRFLRLAKRANKRKLSDALIAMFASTINFRDERTILNLIIAPIALIIGLVLSIFDKAYFKLALANTLGVFPKAIAFDSSDLIKMSKKRNQVYLGCANDFTYKVNIDEAGMSNLFSILGNANLQAISEKQTESLSSLKMIGGHLKLSQRIIDELKVKRMPLFPNLEIIGGKCLVDNKETDWTIIRGINN